MLHSSTNAVKGKSSVTDHDESVPENLRDRSALEHEFELFDNLYNSCAPVLYGVILDITKNETLSSKALSQAFIEIWSHHHRSDFASFYTLPRMLSIASSCAFRVLDHTDKSVANERRREFIVQLGIR